MIVYVRAVLRHRMHEKERLHCVHSCQNQTKKVETFLSALYMITICNAENDKMRGCESMK